ncbi:Sodium-dependent dopamine transporter [Strongyloides ratti]|uniref:Sodium-dependent dopamine transporter n=1 Tax=Strongyloides ratti TaxID=34506 RepID=A0A090L5L3_STRRB|nr:Sodium-dependent dopamine transporter [Strongyloides ratti]CEF65017.1 Sodium-dependent dopamine transporter [Strongyloides ratti]
MDETNDVTIKLDSNVSQTAENISTSHKKEKWDSKLQFLLTCIGFAVGLGNIWRFPALAYENGGAAFLIPYVTLSLLVGFPILFMEFAIGQSTSLGPLKVFGAIVPMLQGVGWGMISISIFTTMYYVPLLSWICLYIQKIATGNFNTIVSCKNEWNSIYCVSTVDDKICTNETNHAYITFNNTCYIVPDNYTGAIYRNMLFTNNGLNGTQITYAAEEYFYKKLLTFGGEFSKSIFEINWEVFISYNIVYFFVYLIVFKGIKIMGKVAFVTSTVPYLIMIFFFIYSLKLDGSSEGIKFFLYEKTDFSTIFTIKTWKLATEQLFLSLSCGIGVTLSLSSHNEKKHNIFKDSLIVIFADNFMSFFGGITTFSILGFMAKRLGKQIDDVVSDGKVLAFVAYPEVAALTSIPVLFSLLFFIMLLSLGLSSVVCFISSIITSFLDNFKKLRRYKTITIFISIFILYILSLPITTKSGIYIFEILNTFAVSFNVLFVATMECISITHFYGINNFKRAIRRMLGQGNSLFSRYFGSSGYILTFCQKYLNPLVLLTLSIVGIYESIGQEYIYGNDQYKIITPKKLVFFGWIVATLPIILIFVGGITEAWKKRKTNVIDILKPNESHILSIKNYEPSPIINYIESTCKKVEESQTSNNTTELVTSNKTESLN